jgi:DNA-directed RNA polymerase specialized sigma24 family protein
MKAMSPRQGNAVSKTADADLRCVTDYATVEDFRRVFTDSMDELYHLSLVLTADHQKAEQCFVSALEDSVKEVHVFKEWAHAWAKRTVIQNAIRQLKPYPLATSFSLALPPKVVPQPSDQDRHFGIDAVVALRDFERFVFVMSVLEHYSEHECSLLLGCPPREIREARARATVQLMNSRRTTLNSEVNLETLQEPAR